MSERPQAMAAPKRRNVLLAVDDSEDAQHACEWMLKNVYRQGDEVHIMHVVAPGRYVLDSNGDQEYLDETPNTLKELEQEAGQFLRSKFVPLLEALQVQYRAELVRCSTDSESVGGAVCARATELEAVAVVLGSHNKGSLRQFFQGSVTQYCMQHCHQPLIVLH